MNVVLINTSDQIGGAAIAAHRIMAALIKLNISASMLVQTKQTNHAHIYPADRSFMAKLASSWCFLYERLVIFLKNGFNQKSLFKVSIANTGTDLSKHPLVVNADIIHLHWVSQGFLSLDNIKKLIALGKPIVWTMHDMWLFTGICHYSWGCLNFQNVCGHCPFLGSTKEKDLSYHTLKKKLFLSNSNIHLVAVSSWLRDMADRSTIAKGLHTSVIPNVIDTAIFKLSDKALARKDLSFPMDKKVILMGAAKLNDPIKGFNYLRQALFLLKKKEENLLLVLFGDIKKDPAFLSALPIDCKYMGTLSNTQTIAQLYVAADVTVVPSCYETFGQTLVESMACGCPVVSFNNSGQTDIIDHKKNGYLAKYQDVEDLAEGILWVLNNENREQLSRICVEKVQTHYTESIVAEKYIALYNQLLNKTTS